MHTLIFGTRHVGAHDLESAFLQRGHTVEVYEDADALWSAYRQTVPELVVLSRVDAESLALCDKVCTEETGTTPVLLVAVDLDDEASLRRAIDAGVDGYLTGAVSASQLDAQLALAEQRVRKRADRQQAKQDLAVRARQQATVAELGQRALAADALPPLMDHTVRRIADALGVEFCEVLRHEPSQQQLVVAAGVGWTEEVMGQATVRTDSASQAGYALASGGPVVVEDVRAGQRFEMLPWLEEGEIVSSLSVVIEGEKAPYGVLEVYTTQPRTFGQDDIHFLQSVANILATAIERRQAEQALRESVARIRAILSTTVDGVITIDARGTIESFNQAAEDIFGYEADEVIGENVRVLMPSPYREEHDSYIQSYHDTGRRKIIGIGREVVGQRKDGTLFPLDLAVSEVELGDRVIFTGVVRDITERRELEQEILHISEQERRRIGQDLHDGLGQMLTGIGLISQNLAQHLQEENHPEADTIVEITEFVKEADQYARSLARGLTPVDLEANGLAAALQRLASNAERLFGIRCTFEQIGEGPLREDTVGTHLYRVAQEAVSNAVKHGKASHVKVSLALGDDKVRLRVQDDGVGFPDEIDEEKRGMGVRIMHYRARIIGASLEISNGLDGGATVTCTLQHADASAHLADEEQDYKKTA